MTEEKFNKDEVVRLVNEYSDLILRVSYTYVKSTHDAEDICQTVFLKLLKSSPSFDNREHERAWIIRTTANTCKDLLRSAFRRKTVNLEAAAGVIAPQEPQGVVLEKVMALPRKYREAIYLFYYEGYSLKEISAITGNSEAAVAAHVSRARKKLHKTLKGLYYEQGI